MRGIFCRTYFTKDMRLNIENLEFLE